MMGDSHIDAIVPLVKNIVGVKYEALSQEVRETAKKFILDTLGVAIAGSSLPISRIIVDQVKDWGGKEESTILVHGGQVPCMNAALIGATMAHALEFDDTHDEAGLHANASV